MQRDKRGRFIRKASEGIKIINGKKYKVKPEAAQAFTSYLQTNPNATEDDWLVSEGLSFLEEYNGPLDNNTKVTSTSITGTTPISTTGTTIPTSTTGTTSTGTTSIPGVNTFGTAPTFNTSYDPLLTLRQKQALRESEALGLSTNFGAPDKIKLSYQDGKYIDQSGREIPYYDIMTNPSYYDTEYFKGLSLNEIKAKALKEKSAGVNIIEDPLAKYKNNTGLRPIDKTKIANFLDFARAGLEASMNNKIANRALAAEKPFLQDISESHRAIYGDYRALVQGELAAAKLRNMASKPMTSDGALLQLMMLDAQIKGQEYIDQGNAKDDAMIKLTREVAWQQEKENQQLRLAVAMLNRQAMLMSEKNKAGILNSRDSANMSQVVSPLLSGIEKRLRTEGALLKYYLDYYDDATTAQDVWNTFDPGLTDSQKALRDVYITKGTTGLTTYINEDKENRHKDWLTLKKIMDDETIRRKALIKGAFVSPSRRLESKNNPYAIFESDSGLFKLGGTIYKAKLSKRTKDNDRAAKSIESSKKIAAKLLEKAIDALYDYKNVEIIAKPKKRKYLVGGGLPFVGHTPVFASSEIGTPKEESKLKKGEDLTTKDILELLKDVNGLPTDIDMINASLSNFIISDTMDPLGLDSSSSIASRYMNLIGLIKKAKANKEWYDKAYDKLRNDGALNEYAVDSTGHFIGMDASGEFARFNAKQVANGEIGDYQLLTNSNLLDIRARYPNAAFNSNLIMEAANGISMEQITEHISKVIQGLGSDKSQTLIFGDQSKEVLAGLKLLQAVAQEVGQDLSISQLYEASIFTENLAKQALLALNYIYLTLPTNMRALLFAKAGSLEGAIQLINNLVSSKLSSTNKLEFSPKNTKKGTSTGKTGNIMIDGMELSPAQMLQNGFGERESILIQDSSSTGLKVEAVTMPITKGSNNEPLGSATLEDVATSNYGGILNFNHASMGGQIIPFEGRRNIAIDGSKIYSMYLPIDYAEYTRTGNIIPDISLIDKVNAVNKIIKLEQITDPAKINAKYEEAGLPVYLNDDGTVIPTTYRRFGVINGTAIDNAFGKNFVASKYLREIDDEDIINGALSIMNKGRGKEDTIKYDAKSFFNFGGLLGDYDSVYQGTIFIPISNDVFLGIAGSGKRITSNDANILEAEQLQKERVSATYKNPGLLR